MWTSSGGHYNFSSPSFPHGRCSVTMGTHLVNAISEKVLTPSWGSFLPGVPGPSLHGCFWVYCLWVLFLAACTEPCILPLSSWKPEVGT